MIEVIDRDSGSKMMAMVLCGISHEEERYVLFAIRRDQVNANIFVCKLVSNSQGLVMDMNFLNGEKDVLDGVVQRLFNHVQVSELEEDGYHFMKNLSLEGSQYFDIQTCYVSSVPRKMVKDCMIYYDLVREEFFSQPVIEVQEDKRKFNEGFVGNVFLILFGVGVIIFCVAVLISVFIGK